MRQNSAVKVAIEFLYHILWELVPLGPKPFQEGLQVVGDGLVEYLLFRLASVVDMGLAVEGKRGHASRNWQGMGQHLALG
jgi:hypothetical protein